MNINALRSKWKVQKDTAFTVTLEVVNNDDEAITVYGCQEGQYTYSDAVNYGSLIDNPGRTVLMLPCNQCVDSTGELVTVEADCRVTRTDTGELLVVNSADKTLKGTWWRCICAKVGR